MKLFHVKLLLTIVKLINCCQKISRQKREERLLE